VIRLAVALREGDDGLTFAAAIALARRVLAPGAGAHELCR
jgi:hypothetical protein